jgi:hypothetical protein
MSEDTFNFAMGEDGKWRFLDEDLSMTIYFRDKGEMDDFEAWFEGEGGESFARYRGSGREYPEICYNCKWFDHNGAGCFNGHLQYAQRKDCEGFEEYE